MLDEYYTEALKVKASLELKGYSSFELFPRSMTCFRETEKYYVRVIGSFAIMGVAETIKLYKYLGDIGLGLRVYGSEEFGGKPSSGYVVMDYLPLTLNDIPIEKLSKDRFVVENLIRSVHANGYANMDVKRSNIIYDPSGDRYHVIDFDTYMPSNLALVNYDLLNLEYRIFGNYEEQFKKKS
jgi:hypothetical protein